MKNFSMLIMLILVLAVILACSLPGAPNVSPSTLSTPLSAQNNNNPNAPESQPSATRSSATQPAVTSPANSSNAPTLPPPAPSSKNNSSTDTTEPSLSNVNTSVDKAYYHDNGCGATTVTVSANVSDGSGTVSNVWVDYQYIDMASGVGGNEWFRTELKPVGGGKYQGTIDLTLKADQELQGNDGTLQYQVYAMDAAGNTRVVPDGFVYGVEALTCFPQAQPPQAPEAITITNIQTYPQNGVHYGNCTTEDTNFNIQATIEPLSRITSATIYYGYNGPGGSFGNYSVSMYQLGIGDYAGDISVGTEAPAALVTDDGTLEAYISVTDVDGNVTDSGWVSAIVSWCPDTAVGNPPQAPSISKGSGLVYNNYSLDLGDSDGDDIIFSHTSSDGTQLLSVWGAELQVNLYADIASCKQSIDSGSTFTAVTIDPQDVVCYKTGSGNYGYIVVNGMFIDLNDSANSYVDISYETEVMP